VVRILVSGWKLSISVGGGFSSVGGGVAGRSSVVGFVLYFNPDKKLSNFWTSSSGIKDLMSRIKRGRER